MRLTLRTMLAFIDGILEPNDAQEIGKKVADSEFATGLVHRIGDVMRRLRLGAPSVADDGLTGDANTVAEYLDNTLLSDHVTDFEKTCLESDVHLAEVAACHQILTLVLGEPAEISPASRQWMYQLQNAQKELQQPAAPDDAASRIATDVQTVFNQSDYTEEPIVVAASVGSVAPRSKSRPRPTVPEYLRESKKDRQASPVAAALLLLVCLAVAALYFTHQLEPDTPLGDALVRFGLVQSQPKAIAAKSPEDRTDSGETPAEASGPLPEFSENGLAETPPVQERDAADSAFPPAANSPVAALIADATEPANPAAAAASPSAAMPGAPSALPPAIEPSGSKVAERGDKTTPLAAPAAESATPPVPSSDIKPTAAPDATSLASLTHETPTAIAGKPDRPPTERAAEKAAVETEPLGKLTSLDQVLLKNATKDGWVRAAADQMLISEPLLVIPTYRPKMFLAGGVTLEVLGGTQLRLLSDDSQEVRLGIQIAFGRVVLKSPAQAGKKVCVKIGDRSGVLSFDDAESSAAVEVRRIHLLGENPETEPMQIVADWFTTAGNVSWSEGNGQEAIRLPPMSQMKQDAQGASESFPAKEIPIWITAEPLNSWDGMASPSMAQGLQVDRPARVALMEMIDSHSQRQKEIRWLALRSLGYIGEFQTIVAALNDSGNKRVWPEYVDYLRTTVARDPDSAKAVRVALETQYPDNAGSLYRMLWGYTNQGLESGEDRELVNHLGNDECLPVRLLASWNLTDITGLGGSQYRPEDTLARRKQGHQGWITRLNAKRIRIKTATEKKNAGSRENAAKSPVAEPGT